MMVSADARYPKRVYLRADQEFMDKVERIRDTHTLKSSSSAIRYAVDYTASCDMENEARFRLMAEEKSRQKENEEVAEEKSCQKEDEEVAEEKSSQKTDDNIFEVNDINPVMSGKRNSSKTDRSADAETLRRVSVEIEALAQDGRRNSYLSEEQVKILLAYQREMSRSVRSLAGLDG